MNDDQLDDLKQFIDSRISQSEAQFEQRFEQLDAKIENLRAEVHDGFAGVGEAVEELHKEDDEIDKRLTKLEHQTAA